MYADQTAVLGPLATYAEPHAYDLCELHAERLSAPRGWEVLRLAPDPARSRPSGDDLLALADAVREAARPLPPRGRRRRRRTDASRGGHGAATCGCSRSTDVTPVVLTDEHRPAAARACSSVRPATRERVAAAWTS